MSPAPELIEGSPPPLNGYGSSGFDPTSDDNSVSKEKNDLPVPSLPEDDSERNVAAPAPAPRPGPGPPPNGGLRAWLHVVGGFMLFFNTWGMLNTFGVFQTYYESGALFVETSSNISWIGSIQSFMVLVGGVFAGPIYDRGYFRALLCVGSFLIVFGHMMLSLCTEFWQVLLAQGFCVGLGAGCLFVPCVSILPTYFSTRLGLAVGLASSGSSLGGIIYPIVLYRLVDKVGFPWSVRVIGFIALGTLLIPISVMKMRFKSPQPRAIIDWDSFRDLPYMVFTIGTLIGFMGLTILVFYISFYPENLGVTDTSLSFYMVAIFNAGSCFGRVIPNAISDKVGAFNMIAPGALITGVLLFCLSAAKTAASIIVIAVLAGFFSGVFIAMPPVCFAHITKDKSRIGTRIGMGFGIISLGLLTGGPGGGGVLGQMEPLNWVGLWCFGGATACVAGLMYTFIRVYVYGYRLNIKA